MLELAKIGNFVCGAGVLLLALSLLAVRVLSRKDGAPGSQAMASSSPGEQGGEYFSLGESCSSGLCIASRQQTLTGSRGDAVRNYCKIMREFREESEPIEVENWPVKVRSDV